MDPSADSRYSFTQVSGDKGRIAKSPHQLIRDAFVFATANFSYRRSSQLLIGKLPYLGAEGDEAADNRYAVWDSLITCHRKHCEENSVDVAAEFRLTHEAHKNFSISLALMIQKRVERVVRIIA